MRSRSDEHWDEFQAGIRHQIRAVRDPVRKLFIEIDRTSGRQRRTQAVEERITFDGVHQNGRGDQYNPRFAASVVRDL